MGLNASKTVPEDTREIQSHEDNNAPAPPYPTEAIVTADYELDPRSPSAGIIRTPIQFLKRTSEPQATPTTATIDKSESPETFIEDPRSPSTEFSRTPIAIKAIEVTNGMKIHNKNLDKALRSFCPSPNIKYPFITEKRTEISEAASVEEAKKGVKIIPPKLLESSPISTKPEVNKRKSFVGLLETNIDFTETDLDVVVALKRKSVAHVDSIEDNLGVNISSNTASRNSSNEAIQLADKLEDVTLEEETTEALIDDNDFIEEVEHLEETPTSNINEIDDAAIKNLLGIKVESEAENICETGYPSGPNFNSLPRNVQKIKKIDKSGDNYSPIASPRVFEIMVDVNNFDKKLTDLIYEDDDVAFIAKTTKPKDNSRTPLANKNSTSEPKRTTKLKVSDKPRRSHIVGPSRIPVSKTKPGKKILTQCENTPPRNKQSLGNKKAQWDTEKTLII